MKSEHLRLDVLSPVETILAVEKVAWVQVQLADGGGLGIYPGHAPLVAETSPAPLRYQDADGEHTVDLESGVLHIKSQGVELFVCAIAEDAPDTTEEAVTAAAFDRLASELLSTLHVSSATDEA